MRSAYHVRELDVYRLLQLRRQVDVGLSHDWPRGIAHHGDAAQLFRAKSFLRREVCLGDVYCVSGTGHDCRLLIREQAGLRLRFWTGTGNSRRLPVRDRSRLAMSPVFIFLHADSYRVGHQKHLLPAVRVRRLQHADLAQTPRHPLAEPSM